MATKAKADRINEEKRDCEQPAIRANPSFYEQAKDTPRGAVKLLLLILAANAFDGNDKMTDERLSKAFHLVGTLGLGCGMPEDEIRGLMEAAMPREGAEWRPGAEASDA